jgi:hypothetical protein
MKKGIVVLVILLANILASHPVYATSIIVPATTGSCVPNGGTQTYTDSTGKSVTVIKSVVVGEKCSYAVTAPSSGTYKLSILAASTNPAGAAMHLEFPVGSNVSGAVVIPNTDCCVGSTPTHFVSKDGLNVFALPAGQLVLTLVIDPTSTYPKDQGAHVNIETLTLTQLAPAVTVSLSATPSSIVSGSSSILSWTSTGATSISIDNSIGSVTPVPTGSYSVTPSITTNYTASAIGPGGSASSSTTVTVTAPVDTTAPSVFISAPGPGVVSGALTVSVSATDDFGTVSLVQILLDGVPLGPSKTVAPYTTLLDTALFSVGIHTLSATATDPSGNIGTAASVQLTITGQLFDVTLVFDDGTPSAAGGTLTIQEDVGTSGAPLWQTDIASTVDAAGHFAFRWPVAIGKVYIIVLTDATGTLLWQNGTQLTPAQVPTSFSGVTAKMQFSKTNGTWLGFSNFVIAY